MAASTGASMVVFTSSKRPAAWHTRLWIGVGQVKLGHPEQAASLTNGGFTADKRRLHCWAQSLKVCISACWWSGVHTLVGSWTVLRPGLAHWRLQVMQRDR